MPTSREFKDGVIENICRFGYFTTRPMMGEYLLYLDGKHIGGIYDDKVLLKVTENNVKILTQPQFLIPYPSAKPMLFIPDDISDEDMERLFNVTFKELQNKITR